MPSPDANVFVASIALVKIASASVITDSSKQGQGVNSPAVLIYRICFVLVQVNVFFRVMIDEKFAVESKIRRRNGFQINAITPDCPVAWNVKGGAITKSKVFRSICIVTNPRDAARLFVEKFGEGIDERIEPPLVFQQLRHCVFAVYRPVEHFAIQTVFITQNRAIILSHYENSSPKIGR